VRSTGTTFCFLALMLFGAMGGTPPAGPGVSAETPSPLVSGPVSVSTGPQSPDARALPASSSFTLAPQESHHTGASHRAPRGASAELDQSEVRPTAPRGIPPRIVAFGLRAFIAHPPTAPPARIA